jgi:murein DD-endopeptidase MepM/ murein hydrolase activator NlpD
VEVIRGTVGKRPVLNALVATGLRRNDAFRVLNAFRGVRKFDRASPADTFVVAKQRATGRVVAFEYATSPKDVYQAREDESGALVGQKLELAVEHRQRAVAVTVGKDLRSSVAEAGLDERIVHMIDDALHGHAELSRVQAGARLRVVATELRIESAFVQYDQLEAVEYLPANGGEPLRVYFFGPSGSKAKKLGGYYDAKGRQPYHGGWRSPVPLARISSRFNPRRVHPVLKVVRPHNGVDYAAPPGTPVYAAAAGLVRSVGDGGPCGNMVQLQHANGLVTAYCHLSRYAAGLRAGQRVEGRQLIGYVGQTGRATGPHLHFAVKRGAVFLDPLSLKLDGVRVVPPRDREAFDARRTELDALIDAVTLPARVPSGSTDGPANDADGIEAETPLDDDPEDGHTP